MRPSLTELGACGRKALGRNRGRLLRAAIVAPVLLAGTAALSQTAETDWLETWSASPQPIWEPDFFNAASIPRALRDQTIRQVARVSQGGDQVRVEISNEYGDRPLMIGGADIALAGEDGAIVPDTARTLTFSGQESIMVPAGAPIWSDPVDLEIEDLTEVAVDLYLPDATPLTTWHQDGVQTAYISENGDFTGEEAFEAAETTNSRLFLSGLAVDAASDSRSIVFFGDSITDGNVSTPNENNRWPDILAERIVAAGSDAAVLNEGISGARILRDRMGDNALARFDRDVLGHPQADTVVLMMGINDIGWPDSPLTPEGEPAPSAEDVIAGYQQLISRAHAHDMRIIGATLTPFEDTFEGGPLEGYYTEEKEEKRVAINDWIRNGGEFDGVIDFDAVMRDPENPKRIQAQYDSGDHLHPNDAGYQAMAESVDLGLLGISE